MAGLSVIGKAGVLVHVRWPQTTILDISHFVSSFFVSQFEGVFFALLAGCADGMVQVPGTTFFLYLLALKQARCPFVRTAFSRLISTQRCNSVCSSSSDRRDGCTGAEMSNNDRLGNIVHLFS